MRLASSIALLGFALQAQEPQRIRLTVERQDGPAWNTTPAALVFNAGDHLRFRLSANFAGYLYVMNHGTSGTYELLFPRLDTGSDNRIEASKDYIVPASQGWFNVSGPAGQDVIYWLVSPVELASPPLPRAEPSGEPPSGLRPRCDDSILKARGECIDDSAGVRPVKPGEALPSNLDGVAGATPVIYELRLSHR